MEGAAEQAQPTVSASSNSYCQLVWSQIGHNQLSFLCRSMHSKRERTGRRDHPQRLARPLFDSIPIQRTFHGPPTPIQHMRVDHRSPHIAVAEQLLHGPYIVEEDKLSYPVKVSLLRANAVVLEADEAANLVKELGHRSGLGIEFGVGCLG